MRETVFSGEEGNGKREKNAKNKNRTIRKQTVLAAFAGSAD